ncbi:hypothetical protein [Thomasclavelia saccharogumia]|uniref:hypothetical protein n=1 Tax=Thomasclavelia saccharogumia TaxID=341225 RepID=UPI00047E6DD1|nr:hypothetical protein [Thomasclavelia saccharogumia]
MNKYAYVYLPYEYDENDTKTQYNIFYLMHGWTGDAKGFQNSRNHRIFGGFSMGAVTTWYTFLQDLDYFKYFIPISGDCWIISENEMNNDETAKYLNEYVQKLNYTSNNFMIYALTRSDDTSIGNLLFQIADEGTHSYTSMIQYIYNALPVFNNMIDKN